MRIDARTDLIFDVGQMFEAGGQWLMMTFNKEDAVPMNF